MYTLKFVFFINHWTIKTQRDNELIQDHRRNRLRNRIPQPPAATEDEAVRIERLFMNL